MKADHSFWLGIPLLNTLSQLFIKLAAEHITGSGWDWLQNAVTSPWMIVVIGVEAACFLVWMQVLTELDLSKAFPLSAVSYILILATGWIIFREEISLLQLAGSGLILMGVWLISTTRDAGSPEYGERNTPTEARRSHLSG